jgi:hypothetical protein
MPCGINHFSLINFQFSMADGKSAREEDQALLYVLKMRTEFSSGLIPLPNCLA